MGLKIFLIIISVSLVISIFLVVGSIWENMNVGEGDVVMKSGTLLSDPFVSKDEYGIDTVAIRFYVQGKEEGLVIPGQLLRQLDKRIFDLKEGAEIKYWVKKNKTIFPINNVISHLFGLEDEHGSILSLQKAFDYYGKVNYFVVVGIFVLFGGLVYTLLQLARIKG